MRVTGLAAILILTFAGCATFSPFKGYPRYDGSIQGLPLRAPVRVYRDAYGIPAIFAGSVYDLLTAQGFVHAQDRLWQMETIRRITNGTLSQVMGEYGMTPEEVRKKLRLFNGYIEVQP